MATPPSPNGKNLILDTSDSWESVLFEGSSNTNASSLMTEEEQMAYEKQQMDYALQLSLGIDPQILSQSQERPKSSFSSGSSTSSGFYASAGSSGSPASSSSGSIRTLEEAQKKAEELGLGLDVYSEPEINPKIQARLEKLKENHYFPTLNLDIIEARMENIQEGPGFRKITKESLARFTWEKSPYLVLNLQPEDIEQFGTQDNPEQCLILLIPFYSWDHLYDGNRNKSIAERNIRWEKQIFLVKAEEQCYRVYPSEDGYFWNFGGYNECNTIEDIVKVHTQEIINMYVSKVSDMVLIQHLLTNNKILLQVMEESDVRFLKIWELKKSCLDDPLNLLKVNNKGQDIFSYYYDCFDPSEKDFVNVCLRTLLSLIRKALKNDLKNEFDIYRTNILQVETLCQHLDLEVYSENNHLSSKEQELQNLTKRLEKLTNELHLWRDFLSKETPEDIATLISTIKLHESLSDSNSMDCSDDEEIESGKETKDTKEAKEPKETKESKEVKENLDGNSETLKMLFAAVSIDNCDLVESLVKNRRHLLRELYAGETMFQVALKNNAIKTLTLIVSLDPLQLIDNFQKIINMLNPDFHQKTSLIDQGVVTILYLNLVKIFKHVDCQALKQLVNFGNIFYAKCGTFRLNCDLLKHTKACSNKLAYQIASLKKAIEVKRVDIIKLKFYFSGKEDYKAKQEIVEREKLEFSPSVPISPFSNESVPVIVGPIIFSNEKPKNSPNGLQGTKRKKAGFTINKDSDDIPPEEGLSTPSPQKRQRTE